MTETDGGRASSRRLFAKRALGEALSFVEEVRGQPQRRLSDLANLPPDKLALLRGTVRSDVGITVSDRGICVVSKDAPDPSAGVAVLEGTPANVAVFNRMNGAQTLGEIADAIAQDLGWEPDKARSHVTSVFLALVGKGVCLPANVVD